MCIHPETSDGNPKALPVYSGTIRGGKVEFDHPVTWPDGVRVFVQVARGDGGLDSRGHAVIAGFGPTGRWVADVLDRFSVPYCIIERNAKTVAAQKILGRQTVFGDVAEEATLKAADICQAGILALTIPEEKVAVKAIRTAKALNPNLLILAKTEYTSAALVARKAGADVVISAEIAVAKEFHELLLLCLTGSLPAVFQG